MTARYYAVKPDLAGRIPVNLPVVGPKDTYDDAVKIHTQELFDRPPSVFPPPPEPFEYRVLLDVSSVANCTEQETMLLLLADPMLHAVFTMGRHAGFEAAKERYGVDGGRC
jgi:hypothetical protein